MATASASTRTSSSAITIMRMFTWKPSHTSGRETRRLYGLKNVSRTAFTPGRAPAVGGRLGELRDGGEAHVEPLLLQLRDRAVVGQLGDGLVDHRGELAVL